MYRKNQLVSYKSYPGVYIVKGWIDGIRVKEISGCTRNGKAKGKKCIKRTYILKDIMESKCVTYEAFENELVAAYSSRTVTRNNKKGKNKCLKVKQKIIQSNNAKEENSAISNLEYLRHSEDNLTEPLTESSPMNYNVNLIEENIHQEINPFLEFLNYLK